MHNTEVPGMEEELLAQNEGDDELEDLAIKFRKGDVGSHPSLRLIDKELREKIETLDIDCPPVILERLFLLDKSRRSHGQLIKGDYTADGVVKHMETHLEHSLKLITICENFANVFPEEWKHEYLPKIEASALFHDIGKTGPADAMPEEREAYSLLFSFFEPDKEKGKNFKNTSIGDVVDRHASEEEKQVIMNNLSGLGLSPEQPMSEVFGRHVDYTYQILKTVPDMDPEIIYLAASHHRNSLYTNKITEQILRELLPADKVRAENLDKAATLLELADNFEARSSRGEQKPPEVVIGLMINEYEKKSGNNQAEAIRILKDIKARFEEKR